MTPEQFLNLHKYLHDSTIMFVTYNNERVPVYKNREGLRFVTIEGVKYIQQNPKKDTAYGNMARNGHSVTWGIKNGKWNLAIDSEIKTFG